MPCGEQVEKGDGPDAFPSYHFFSSFVLALTGAMMPRLLLTANIGESLRRGFIVGPLLIAGHGILELLLLVALLSGLSPLFHQRWFFIAVSLAGGSIPLWMAWFIRRALPDLKLSEDIGRGGCHNLVLRGIAVSFATPILPSGWPPLVSAIFSTAFVSAWGDICLFYRSYPCRFLLVRYRLTCLGKMEEIFEPRLYRGIMAATAPFLALFACYFFISGWTSWSGRRRGITIIRFVMIKLPAEIIEKIRAKYREALNHLVT